MEKATSDLNNNLEVEAQSSHPKIPRGIIKTSTIEYSKK